MNNFILFSEASSLPRLQNLATSEFLHISLPKVKNIFPKPDSLGEIALPKPHSAPLFILLNPVIVSTKSSPSIHLTYFLDNSANIAKLPNMSSHLKGLEWLNSILPGKTKEDFVIAWLAAWEKQMAIAGAADSDLLLVNYSIADETPFNKTMFLYVGLHEAFHQFIQKVLLFGWL